MNDFKLEPRNKIRFVRPVRGDKVQSPNTVRVYYCSTEEIALRLRMFNAYIHVSLTDKEAKQLAEALIAVYKARNP